MWIFDDFNRFDNEMYINLMFCQLLDVLMQHFKEYD